MDNYNENIDIRSTNVRAHFVTCTACDKVWRTTTATRCPRCAQRFGLTFALDGLRASQLMDAMREFETENKEDEDDELRLAIAMEDNCQWYNYEDPWYSQTCYMNLHEYLRDLPPTPHIERAMEIFRAQFQTTVANVDENGEMPTAQMG